MAKLQTSLDVLMPFHHLGAFFEEAILSVLQSVNVKITLLLLDNRRDSRPNLSLKSFEKILKNTSHKIKVLPVNVPYTYSNALNTGIANSSAEYIALMNSDDLVAPERFYLQLNQLIFEKGDISICALNKFFNNRKIWSIPGQIDLQNYSHKYLLLGSYGADATIMMRRKWIISKSRFFPESQQSDWLFALKYYSGAKIVSINKPLYFYRMHNEQVTRNNQLNTLENEIILKLEEHFQSIGIPIKNFNALIAISAPYLRVKLRFFEMKEFLDICEKYLSSFDHLDQQNHVKKILGRRILITLRQPYLFLVVHPKWWITVGNEAIHVINGLLMGKFKIFLLRSN